ncbi:rubisco accumulation factor 1.1, chloroplastic [Mercurialis annua]|uniref:rubisco accumulation factor 1.1, chloroplastic n=1 Tax=Mercurialis annua TaxID=3986 RepID=UPI00215F51E2|nr:rubisco accumulation factor 1.1, chloroplastic [Mercurialis annua]
MLSATVNTHIPISVSNLTKPYSSPFISPTHLHLFTVHSPSSKTLLKPISASLIPAKPPPVGQNLYQPFRPPPSPLPSQYKTLDTVGKIDVLSNRLGLWHEYAPLITALMQEGFSPPLIEETTGISGVQQNCLIVGAQVRESLIQCNTPEEIVSEFDTGGAELLYEIRLLSASQRTAAAAYIVNNKLDTKGAQDLARAMKDFPSRRGDVGWESYDFTLPGDCLSYMYFRQAREHRNPSEQRANALELALEVAESEKARNEVEREMSGDGKGGEAVRDVPDVRVPVVRLRIGEVAESTSVVVLPVCRAEYRENEISEAPWECKSEGEFGVVVAEKAWNRWVVFPRWEPLLGLDKGGVVIAFADARALPWKANRWYKEESILVVADRGRKEVDVDDGFYLVLTGGSGDGRSSELKVERGSTLKERGVVESLATVVLVVRPPKDEIDDQLADEDWD